MAQTIWAPLDLDDMAGRQAVPTRLAFPFVYAPDVALSKNAQALLDEALRVFHERLLFANAPKKIVDMLAPNRRLEYERRAGSPDRFLLYLRREREKWDDAKFFLPRARHLLLRRRRLRHHDRFPPPGSRRQGVRLPRQPIPRVRRQARQAHPRGEGEEGLQRQSVSVRHQGRRERGGVRGVPRGARQGTQPRPDCRPAFLQEPVRDARRAYGLGPSRDQVPDVSRPHAQTRRAALRIRRLRRMRLGLERSEGRGRELVRDARGGEGRTEDANRDDERGRVRTETSLREGGVETHRSSRYWTTTTIFPQPIFWSIFEVGRRLSSEGVRRPARRGALALARGVSPASARSPPSASRRGTSSRLRGARGVSSDRLDDALASSHPPSSVSAPMVLTCVVCRSQAFDETDEGFFVCLRCGTQSQDVVREVEDEELAFNHAGGGVRGVRSRRAPPSEGRPRRAPPPGAVGDWSARARPADARAPASPPARSSTASSPTARPSSVSSTRSASRSPPSSGAPRTPPTSPVDTGPRTSTPPAS